MRLGAALITVTVALSLACGPGPRRGPPPSSEEVAAAWTPPAEGARSVILTIEPLRDDAGGLRFKGTTLLPPGMKLWVELASSREYKTAKRAGLYEYPLQADAYVANGGAFTQAESFTQGGLPLPGGQYEVRVFGMFNGAWQSSAVLALAGDGGSKFTKGLLVPDDAEFSMSDAHVEERRTIEVPPLSPQLIAIEAVKNARLTTPETPRKGQPVRENVAMFESVYASEPDMLRSVGWTAAFSAEGKWIVTLNLIEDHKPTQAQWQYDPATKRVKYLDPKAKIFSQWYPD